MMMVILLALLRRGLVARRGDKRIKTFGVGLGYFFLKKYAMVTEITIHIA